MKLVVLALAHRRAAALDASRLVEHAGECATAGRLRAVLAALSGRVAVSRAAAAAAEAHAARAAATRADLGAAAGFHAWAAAAREARWRREQLRRGLLRYRRALLTAGLAHWAASVRSGRLALLRVRLLVCSPSLSLFLLNCIEVFGSLYLPFLSAPAPLLLLGPLHPMHSALL